MSYQDFTELPPEGEASEPERPAMRRERFDVLFRRFSGGQISERELGEVFDALGGLISGEAVTASGPEMSLEEAKAVTMAAAERMQSASREEALSDPWLFAFNTIVDREVGRVREKLADAEHELERLTSGQSGPSSAWLERERASVGPMLPASEGSESLPVLAEEPGGWKTPGPCPWCGNKHPDWEWAESSYRVKCISCLARGPSRSSKESAFAAWDATPRASTPAEKARLAEGVCREAPSDG